MLSTVLQEPGHLDAGAVSLSRRITQIDPSRAEAEAAVRTLIRFAGDDPSREGLTGTPERVVRAMIAHCRQGPPAALVRELTEETEAGPIEPGFHQAPTF